MRPDRVKGGPAQKRKWLGSGAVLACMLAGTASAQRPAEAAAARRRPPPVAPEAFALMRMAPEYKPTLSNVLYVFAPP